MPTIVTLPSDNVIYGIVSHDNVAMIYFIAVALNHINDILFHSYNTGTKLWTQYALFYCDYNTHNTLIHIIDNMLHNYINV
jgi:hypothetical protein